ncbi:MULTISPECIES: nicotinate-nucleotide adenylyltransferase [Bacillus]|uniref:nicotinate-nucleotide adenylyltransferase n=1 Tax=Bacillus TaxID=1386 RepID=UPI0002FCFB54|nr:MULTISPECIES: nicotinate-nucleotide adenylyltransferase [Bacillus]
MKKVGILGGTFDPPHIGHAIIANEVLSALQLDEIRFMPNHTPPHKQKTKSVSNEERVDMIQLTIEDHPQFVLDTIELDSPGTSYTFNTIEQLINQEPDTKFYFIIGADMIEYLPNWYRVDDLVNMVQFVGVKRPPYTVETSYPIVLIDVPQIYLSSSMIRDKVKKGETIRYLVPRTVEKYIEENALYES